jgi:steroid delta-isomerase-like uncharacterized protein
MTPDELARGYAIRYWTEADDSFIDEAFTSDAVYHDPMLPDLPAGTDGPRQRKAAYESALSESHVDLHDLVASDDRVAMRWTYRGRFSGEFMGRPPTGETLTISGMHFFRIQNGRIAEAWVEYDSAGFLRDIGALPSM